MTKPLVALTFAILALQPRMAGAGARMLDFVEEVQGQRLRQPVASVISPDGAFVYVADYYYYYYYPYTRSLSVFARDAGTGELSFASSAQNGVDGVVNLVPGALALSPDGAHLYAAGGDSIAVFSRDAGTGALIWVETKQNGVDGVTSMSSVQEIVVSPDGAHAYVTSNSPGSVVVFSRNATTGALTFVEAKGDGAPTELYGARALKLSPDGAHLYVGSYYDGALITFSRNAGTGALTFVESDSVSGPFSIAVTPDGAHVYVTSYSDRLSVYTRNAGTGALTFEEVHVDGTGGITAMSYPEDVMVSPDGAHVYVAASYDSALVVFSRNAGNGHLTLVEEQKNATGGVIGIGGANSIVSTPDGADVYVTAGGTYYYYASALTGFSRDAGTGSLTQIQFLNSSEAPNALALSPDGAHLYGAAGSKLSVWARDGGTGSLTHTSDVYDDFYGVNGVSGGTDIAVSPDGAHVYVTGAADSALAAFSRNATTGALTFVEVERDGVGGVDGLSSPRDLAISADGAYLYVASGAYYYYSYDNAISVFARDAGTGEITQTQVVQDGVGGVVGLTDLRAMALSPDGAHIYAAADDGTLATFSRNAGTGALTQIGVMDLGDENPYQVAVSPDGAFVYLLLYDSKDLIRVYSRNAATGALTVAGSVKENEAGLYLPASSDQGFDFTPDGGTVYLAGAIFSRNPVDGSLAFVGAQSGGPGYVNGATAVGPNGELYTGANDTVQLFTQGFAGCDGGPMPVCRPTSGGVVRLGAAAPTFNWTWKSASTVLPGDFGDPVLTDHYALCMWDESGPTPTLIMRALAPAGQQCTPTKGCWATTATGVGYRDRVRTPEGIGSFIMKAGAGDAARVKVVAGKSHLVAPSFPLPLPIRMQLQSSAGACFEATFSTSGFNNTLGFLAKPD